MGVIYCRTNIRILTIITALIIRAHCYLNGRIDRMTLRSPLSVMYLSQAPVRVADKCWSGAVCCWRRTFSVAASPGGGNGSVCWRSYMLHDGIRAPTYSTAISIANAVRSGTVCAYCGPASAFSYTGHLLRLAARRHGLARFS